MEMPERHNRELPFEPGGRTGLAGCGRNQTTRRDESGEWMEIPAVLSGEVI
jgi:hypothetical protein